jgi:hypothetical protein
MAALSLADTELGSTSHQRHLLTSQIRNELVIKLVSCKKLKPQSQDKPAAFIMFQFYEYPEVDTVSISLNSR